MFEYIRAQPTALEAQKEGERYSVRQRPDWDSARVDVMDWVLKMRTCQYPDFADALDATGNAELVLNDIVSLNHTRTVMLLTCVYRKTTFGDSD